MWESRRDFQGLWEGCEAGSMAFHASTARHFHGLLFARELGTQHWTEAHLEAVELAEFRVVKGDAI